MKIIGIIPARMASSRFPGKPLKLIHGIPMIGHVYYRSKMNKILDEVYVATCDHDIADYVKSIKGIPIITSVNHERASDRAAEALRKIEHEYGNIVDYVVMIQGDEPMLVPEMITESVQPLIKDRSILVTNLMGKIKNIKEYEDPNEIKVIVDKNNFALYFSREPIPSSKKCNKDFTKYKQVCIICFKRDFLLKFTELAPTPLEEIESIDMLRILEHGYQVKMVPIENQIYSVDTENDLKKVEKLMISDPLLKEYM